MQTSSTSLQATLSSFVLWSTSTLARYRLILTEPSKSTQCCCKTSLWRIMPWTFWEQSLKSLTFLRSQVNSRKLLDSSSLECLSTNRRQSPRSSLRASSLLSWSSSLDWSWSMMSTLCGSLLMWFNRTFWITFLRRKETKLGVWRREILTRKFALLA